MNSVLHVVIICGLVSTAFSQNNGDVRLVAGKSSSEGRLEVYYKNTWGTVCDDHFDSNYNAATCLDLTNTADLLFKISCNLTALLNPDVEHNATDIQPMANIENTLITLNKKITQVKNKISKTVNPNPMNYKSWNTYQMVNWISQVESRRFAKYADTFREGFESDEVEGEHLPQITALNLKEKPFQIENTNDRNDLISYFKKLSQKVDKGIPNKVEPIVSEDVVDRKKRSCSSYLSNFNIGMDRQAVNHIYTTLQSITQYMNLLGVLNCNHDKKEMKYIESIEWTMTSYGLLEQAAELRKKIDETVNPNTLHYKSWNLNQMMHWIDQLESGKYRKYVGTLRAGFKSDGIDKGGDLLTITASNLRSEPFTIMKLVDRNNLVSHFKTLANVESSDVPLKHEV
eukprot:152211_1